MLASTVLILGFAFESDLGRYESLYMAVLACLVFGGLFLGYVIRVKGLRKQDLEVERGYTCDKAIALRDPGLYAVNYKTGAVIARPHEGR